MGFEVTLGTVGVRHDSGWDWGYCRREKSEMLRLTFNVGGGRVSNTRINERAFGHDISQLFMCVHTSDRNGFSQNDSFKQPRHVNTVGAISVLRAHASCFSWSFEWPPRAPQSCIPWRKMRSLECWMEHGQSYQMACYRQNANIDANNFPKHSFAKVFPRHHPIIVMRVCLRHFWNLCLAKTFLTRHSCEKLRLAFCTFMRSGTSVCGPKTHNTRPDFVPEPCKSPAKDASWNNPSLQSLMLASIYQHCMSCFVWLM